jgi:hypothetical protein
VHLISLDRHGLEMEPRWRDALSAPNIVAPGAAAIDLGLRVAQGSHLVTAKMYRWRPLRTARNRSAPMGCGPNVDQARPLAGQRRSASRTLPGKADPRRLPRQASPAWAIALLGGALAGSGPGTSPLYRRAVPGHHHGGPQHPACSNHADDGGCLDEHGTMRPISRGAPKLVRRRWGGGIRTQRRAAGDQRFLMLCGPGADQRPHLYQESSRDAFSLVERATTSLWD